MKHVKFYYVVYSEPSISIVSEEDNKVIGYGILDGEISMSEEEYDEFNKVEIKYHHWQDKLRALIDKSKKV